MMQTESRGASNAKAKRELGWEPRYPSWRQGFVAAYASPPRLRMSAISSACENEAVLDAPETASAP